MSYKKGNHKGFPTQKNVPTKIVREPDFLHSESTKTTFRLSASDFSRNSGKLYFSQYALLGISLLKNSLASEVYNILTFNDLVPITKSAYSQGRYKIKNSFYEKWASVLLHEVYKAGLAYTCWRVEAIAVHAFLDAMTIENQKA